MPTINENLPAFASITAPLEFLPAEAAAEGQKPKKPTVKFDAYAGGIITLEYWGPTAFELSGIKDSKRSKILFNHIQGIGHITEMTINPGIRAKGVIDMYGIDADATKVVETSKGDDPYPWECSVGIYPDRNGYKFIAEGETATVNGKELKGPFFHILKGTVKEISIVYIGAEPRNQVSIAAKGANMPELNPAPEGATGNQPAQATASAVDSNKIQRDIEATRAAKAAAVKAEDDRTSAIEDVCAASIEKYPEIRKEIMGIKAKAMADGKFTAIDAELEILRKARPANASIANQAPGEKYSTINANTGSGVKIDKIAVASAAMLQAVSNVDPVKALAKMKINGKRFDKSIIDSSVEEAGDVFKCRAGLKQIVNYIAEAAGYNGGHGGDAVDAFKYMCNASISTINVGSIFSNVMNQIVLEPFDGVDQAWRRFCYVDQTNDFKEKEMYRPDLRGLFEKVGAEGAVKHATLEELKNTISAEHFALKFAVTTKTVRNDNIGILAKIPMMFQRAAGITTTTVIYKTLFDNLATIFTAGKGNLLTTVSAASLDATGYKNARKAFRTRKVGDAYAMREPKIVVCPTILEYAADVLNQTPPSPTAGNVWYNKYEPVATPFFEDAAYGNTSTAFMMSVDAKTAGTGVICVTFLDGQEFPKIENYLIANGDDGFGFKADFGVGAAPFDDTAAVYCTGAA